MASTLTADLSDDEFWRMIADATFANPFSDQRYELDRQIAGHFEGERQRAELLKNAVCDRVERLKREGRAQMRHFRGPALGVMRNGFLFEVYHRFYAEFDALIAEQIAAGDTPCQVRFASEALALLRQRGFTAEEALRFFGIFYQLRRAFYFIAGGLTGHSLSMKELRRHLWNNVFTHDIRWYDQYLWNRMEDFSTLLLGETGTGKGTAAAAIGRSGFIPFNPNRGTFAESFTHSFLSLNLSQFSEALIESELFGHKKGAFTGAIEAHEGVLARCSPHGAIFLDEIGEVSIPVQIKLLQVLQERTFSPVGGHEKVRFSGRVIAATNSQLDELRRQKVFRDDFYYRLCSDIIIVPSLRERIQELPAELDLLIEKMVTRMTGADSPELTSMVKAVLDQAVGRDYHWPGNVRELEQAVRRILLTRRYAGQGRDLDLKAALQSGIESGTLDAEALLSGYCTLLHQRHGTFEEVSRRTRLDRRTVKKYVSRRNAADQSGVVTK
jgi:transcriptional regulator with AAA-type ATPase domain